MSWKNLSLQQLWRSILVTFLRFPLTLLSAFFGTAISFKLLDFGFDGQLPEQFLWKLLVFAWLGLILFFDLELLAERYAFSRKKSWLLFAAGLAFLISYYFYLPENLYGFRSVNTWLQLFLVGLGLHLLASFAPYFNLKTENGFWQFNEQLFLRFLTATLYSGVLFVGLSIAIVAVQQLFQVHLNGKIYAWLWLIMAGIFHPYFFLAGVPANLQALETEMNYPKGLKVFTQFVLLPLVTIYLLILYGYLGKIIITWTWPRGWVSYLVLSFSIVGIFSLLLIHPIRNTEGNTWIKTYAKWFYRALFPLLILFALAIWRRVSDYGITEERYLVLVLAGWLLAVALYFLFSKAKNIKFIPVTLCLLAFLSAFGPWSAFAISERSQLRRLENFFRKNGMFSAGKLVPATKKVSQTDAREISSIMSYLAEKHSLESLKPWFSAKLKQVYNQPYPDSYYQNNDRVNDLFMALNLQKYLWQNQDITNMSSAEKGPPERKSYYFSGAGGNFYTTTGYDYMVTPQFSPGSDAHYFYRFSNGSLSIENQVKNGNYTQRLFFKWNEKDTSSINLKPFMRQLIKAQDLHPPKGALTQYATVGKARLKLEFKAIEVSEFNGEASTINFNVNVFIKAPAVSGSESGK